MSPDAARAPRVPVRLPVRLLVHALAALALGLPAGAARAVPSFARQTGQPCAMCHVGGYGPQLTEFGIQFKLGAYTLLEDGAPPLPLAGMVLAGFTHTRKAQDASGLSGHGLAGGALRGNNNLTLDQVSLFVAGRLAEHVGVFSQVTYDGIAREASIDNVDLRAAVTVRPGVHRWQLGLSVNDNPGIQDPFNTLPAWAFPFVTSAVAPAPSASTLLDGAFARKALGVVGYAWLDETWYGELGTYRMMPLGLQKFLGIGIADRDPGALRSPLYARLAAHLASGPRVFTAGAVMFRANVQPDRGSATTLPFRDTGLDASWRWTDPVGCTATVLGAVLHESGPGGPRVEYGVAASWYGTRGWGGTVQRFGVNAPGLPSRGTRLQVDWTPFGRQPIGFPDLNLRLGLQYTAYDRLDGARGAAASAGNSLFVLAWLAF